MVYDTCMSPVGRVNSASPARAPNTMITAQTLVQKAAPIAAATGSIKNNAVAGCRPANRITIEANGATKQMSLLCDRLEQV